MAKRFITLLLIGSGLLPAHCSSDRYPYEIPDNNKETYELDCRDYCEAEAYCLVVPEDTSCKTLCSSYKNKGAFQATYLDGRANCLESLHDTCKQEDLDACRDYAFSLCRPAPDLDFLLKLWCGRWLECNDSPVDRYLQRCLNDLEANPDSIILSCLNAPAVEQFQACVHDADCENLESLPLLTLCSGVYR